MLAPVLLFAMLSQTGNAVSVPSSARSLAAAQRVLPTLRAELTPLHAAPGDPVFLRIHKREAQLQLWIQPAGSGDYQLFRSYPICSYSGTLGPKTREGDGQAPEGIYAIKPRQLNPHSQYHLSFNLGYPNAYEQGQGWTGSALMVHGQCVSIGCFAMTDPYIEQIYTLVSSALQAGQSSVPVHSFPFRMDATTLAAEQESPHHAFWQQLLPIHEAFEKHRAPPKVRISARAYQLLP